MSANLKPPDDEREPSPTLGSLLFAGAGKPHTAETEWVALLQSIEHGDQSAFRDLYDRLHTFVYTLIVRIVQNRQTAEDVTLDVFHDIWRRAHSYDVAGGTVVGWVMNQARSRAIDQIRFEHRKKRVNPYPDSAELMAEADPGDEIDGQARGLEVRIAVAGLALHERSAIETAFFSDCTYAETAARLDEPAGTIKTRIRSGLQKLRQALPSDEDR